MRVSQHCSFCVTARTMCRFLLPGDRVCASVRCVCVCALCERVCAVLCACLWSGGAFPALSFTEVSQSTHIFTSAHALFCVPGSPALWTRAPSCFRGAAFGVPRHGASKPTSLQRFVLLVRRARRRRFSVLVSCAVGRRAVCICLCE